MEGLGLPYPWKSNEIEGNDSNNIISHKTKNINPKKTSRDWLVFCIFLWF